MTVYSNTGNSYTTTRLTEFSNYWREGIPVKSIIGNFKATQC